MFFLLASSLSFAVPQQFTQQGRLIDVDGNPIDGEHNLTFHLYETPISTTPLWGESLSVSFQNGYYTVVLGSDVANHL